MASTTAPVMGGKTMPPEMAATSKEPPTFVWRPRPRRPRVKMVAKQADSKHRTRISMAMDEVPLVVTAATEKTKHNDRYSASM